jgi:hypothetical protein
MNLNDHFVAELKRSQEFLKMTVADLSDADLMVRPVPNANHANWQLGHLICSEAGILGSCGAKMPELPAGFKDLYTGRASAANEDASKFAKKEALLALFDKVRAASIEWVKTVTPQQFEAKGPFDFVPTVAAAVGVGSVHVAMHLGQIQVLRRKLGKPILF